MSNYSINKSLFQSPLHPALIRDIQINDSFALDDYPKTPEKKRGTLIPPPAPRKVNPYKRVDDMSEHVQRVLF